MRLVSLALLALCATCFAQENTWFYIENWSEAGCTGALQVTGIIADGVCHGNPPDGFVKATCTGGTPNFETCTDAECADCTPVTPPTTCQSIEGGIYQKATCSDGTYPDGNNYILKHDYSELEGNATCSGDPFRLTYLPLGCTTTASFGAPSAFYECSAGTPSGQECSTSTCSGTCTDLTLAADCFVNTNGIASTHECSGTSGVTPSTPSTTTTSGPSTTPTTTPTSAPTLAPKAAPTGTPATTNAPSSASRFGFGLVLGAIVLAL